ncbi:hypothetical protein BAY59_10230 [Prauserella coralliicola]|nr:hypothetical protein BAY59_10230 [Prauserella coralliicola]
MAIREPVPDEHSQAFTEVAQGARITWHMFHACGDPVVGSNFSRANELYPFEKVSDRARHYVTAAFEHLLMWADYVAPLKFHPEQTINFTLRPTYTLARAAMESAAQGVWLMNTRDPIECIRRHLRLIRWDIQEHRKSFLDSNDKERCHKRDADLLARVAERFADEELRPPKGYLAVLQFACEADDLDLDAASVERLWRAASGAAHGMYWPNLELQTLNIGDEYEPGHFRAQSLPDTAVMADVIRTAFKMTQFAALQYLSFAGADPSELVGPAMRWLTGNMTLKPDADRELLDRLTADRPPGWEKG